MLLNFIDAKRWNVSNTKKHYAEILAAQLQMSIIVLLKMFATLDLFLLQLNYV